MGDSRRQYLERLRSLERTLARLYNMRAYVPGDDEDVRGTEAWRLRQIRLIEMHHTKIVQTLRNWRIAA